MSWEKSRFNKVKVKIQYSVVNDSFDIVREKGNVLYDYVLFGENLFPFSKVFIERPSLIIEDWTQWYYLLDY